MTTTSEGPAARWFAAKSVYRTWLEKAPTAPDAAAEDAAKMLLTPLRPVEAAEIAAATTTVVEERVVLFLAKSIDDALERAEREANSYSESKAVNLYGQHLATRVLSYFEAFELSQSPGDSSEVFSRTFLCPSKISDEEITNSLCPEDAPSSELREFFEPNFSETARRIAEEEDAIGPGSS